MEKKLMNVSVADIDVGDDCYRLPRFAEVSLAASIREVGLLNPPLLQRRPDGRFRIVCGFRRIEALVQLAVAETVAWIVEEPAVAADIFRIALLDNLSLRPFDPVQLSVIIEKLRRWGVSDHDLVRQILPQLGLGQNPKILALYDRLHWLPAEWQRALANDQVPLDLERLKEWLLQKRYPRYAAAKERFDEMLKQASLPDGVTLRHSPFFHDDELQLTVSFRSTAEFDARLDAVQRLRHSGRIEKFAELI